MRKEKSVEQYRLEILDDYSVADEVRDYRGKNKNLAMWQLLREEKIMPISKKLWATTKAGWVELNEAKA